MRVADMGEAAHRAVARAKGTTGGIDLWVGYRDGAIVAGDRVRRSLPHERVHVAPGADPLELAITLGVAAAKLRRTLPKALAAEGRPKPPPPSKGHAWARRGALSGKAKRP